MFMPEIMTELHGAEQQTDQQRRDQGHFGRCGT
jgi:hypothetical protein